MIARLRLLCFVVLAAGLAASAWAQGSSRPAPQDPKPAGQEDASKEPKSIDQVGDEPAIVARWRDRYVWLKNEGLHFTAGSILPGSSFSVGAAVGRERVIGYIGGMLTAQWSIRGYQQYDLEAGRIKERHHRAQLRPIDADITSAFNDNSLLAFGWSLYFHARDREYPRMDFFGLGQRTSVDARSDYQLHGRSMDIVAQWQRPHLGVAGRIGQSHLKLAEPTNDNVPDTALVFTPLEAPGLESQHRYREAGAGVTIDYRDKAKLTETGTFLSAGAWKTMAMDVDEPALGFQRLVLDARQFVRLRNYRHILALHGVMSSRLGEIEHPTPFFLQPTIGGSKTLRGFGSYRLRGEAVWAATAEYRFRAHRRLEIAPFIDAGAVATSFGGLRHATLETSPGIGLRFIAAERVIGRLDLARSRDGARLVFAISAPF